MSSCHFNFKRHNSCILNLCNIITYDSVYRPNVSNMTATGRGEVAISCVLPSSCKDALVSRQLPSPTFQGEPWNETLASLSIQVEMIPHWVTSDTRFMRLKQKSTVCTKIPIWWENRVKPPNFQLYSSAVFQISNNPLGSYTKIALIADINVTMNNTFPLKTPQMTVNHSGMDEQCGEETIKIEFF